MNASGNIKRMKEKKNKVAHSCILKSHGQGCGCVFTCVYDHVCVHMHGGMHVCAMSLKRENVLRVYWTVLSVLG